MATRRQKKLEQKRKKRREKRHDIHVAQHAGLAEQMRRAASAPVHHCLMARDIVADGIGHVIFSRQLPDRQITVAMFLVNVYCLGVKDCFARVLSTAEFESMIASIEEHSGKLSSIDAATTRRLVEAAVAYATDLGLPPHADYRKLAPIFGDVAPADGVDVCEFGQNGKPHFISGPNDSPERCRRIVAALEKACGPDGYHVTVLAGVGRFSSDGNVVRFDQGEFEILDYEYEDNDEDE